MGMKDLLADEAVTKVALIPLTDKFLYLPYSTDSVRLFRREGENNFFRGALTSHNHLVNLSEYSGLRPSLLPKMGSESSIQRPTFSF